MSFSSENNVSKYVALLINDSKESKVLVVNLQTELQGNRSSVKQGAQQSLMGRGGSEFINLRVEAQYTS